MFCLCNAETLLFAQELVHVSGLDWTGIGVQMWIGSGLDVGWSPDVADGASMQICISCSMIHSLKTTYFKVIGIRENTTLLF